MCPSLHSTDWKQENRISSSQHFKNILRIYKTVSDTKGVKASCWTTCTCQFYWRNFSRKTVCTSYSEVKVLTHFQDYIMYMYKYSHQLQCVYARLGIVYSMYSWYKNMASDNTDPSLYCTQSLVSATFNVFNSAQATCELGASPERLSCTCQVLLNILECVWYT